MKWKTDWDDAIDPKSMFSKCEKLLRKNGVCILFSQEPYTSQMITQTHWNMPFNYRMIWKKDHFANALVAKKAPVSYFEDICVFTKDYDTDFLHPLRPYSKKILDYIWKWLREINKELWHRRLEHFFYHDTLQFWLCTEKSYIELIEKYNIDCMDWFFEFSYLEEIEKRFEKRFNLQEWKKYKSNILEYKKDYSWLHPTQKPVALIEDLVCTYTNPWDLVLDFTAWSFTTAVACENTWRKWVCIEKDENYFEIWCERLLEWYRKIDALDI